MELQMDDICVSISEIDQSSQSYDNNSNSDQMYNPKYDISNIIEGDFQEFSNFKLDEIISLFPKVSQYMFENDGQPFNLIEDIILILCGNERTLNILLVNKKQYKQINGSHNSLQFWAKIIKEFQLKRSSNACRSRYLRILKLVHPKEYNEYIDLLQQKEYDCQIKYGTHVNGKFRIIRKVVRKKYLGQKNIQIKDKQINPLNFQKQDDDQCNSINGEIQWKQISDEYYEEKKLIQQMAFDEKVQQLQIYRDCLFEWINQNQLMLETCQMRLYVSLCEVNLLQENYLEMQEEIRIK